MKSLFGTGVALITPFTPQLKVDVEGFEKEVLNGNEWSSLRPWVVVVEAMVPNTQIENHAEWEGILLGANYAFAYADGLNRYYVAEERAEKAHRRGV